MRHLTASFLVLFVGCGDSDSTADIGKGQFAAEEEVGTTADALVSNSAQTWLPMQEGNTWRLRSADGQERVISYSDVGGGIGWLEGLSRSGEWMGVASSAPNSLYAWDNDEGWLVKFRFGYAVTPWSSGLGCDQFTLKRAATGVTVVTPAGSFSDARTIGYRHTPPPNARCMVPLFQNLTFAPNVGPVMFYDGQGTKFVLVEASVNGKKYPAQTGAVTGTLTFDKSSYANKTNTIQCITTPCPGNAVTATAKFTYVVKNGTSSPMTWQFSTGCQYDLSLADSSGAVVRKLSHDRICTQALSVITLAPGATKTITGSLLLNDDEGLQLLTGRYTAKAFLIPRAGVQFLPVATASQSFQLTTSPAIP